MKKLFIVLFASLVLATAGVRAQGCKDAFAAGVGFAVNTPGSSKAGGSDMADGAKYRGEFYKFGIFGTYEKFVWKGFFVMPGVSLWYNDSHDYLYQSHVNSDGISYPDNMPCKLYGEYICPDSKAWQIGGTVSAMIAWRQQFKPSFSIDFLTGPMLDLCFKGKVSSKYYEYDNLFRTASFAYRFGLAANIKTHWRIGVDFDLRTTKNKNVDLGVVDKTPYHQETLRWIASGKKPHNAWTISLGYRF